MAPHSDLQTKLCGVYSVWIPVCMHTFICVYGFMYKYKLTIFMEIVQTEGHNQCISL